MTMTPESFHDLYEAAVAAGPSTSSTEADLAAGRRLLRRRRFATGAAALSLVAILGGAYAALAGGTGGSKAIDPARAPERATSAMLERCKAAPADRAVDAVFGPGDPAVALADQTSVDSYVVLGSADGAAWATCYLPAGGAPAELFAWATEPPAQQSGIQEVPMEFVVEPLLVAGCSGESCPGFTVRAGALLPAEVATVEIELYDGEQIQVPTKNGYYVFDQLGNLPEGESLADRAFDPIVRMTYLDAAGEPIAENAFDRQAPVPSGGLPFLMDFVRAYPLERPSER